MSFNFNDQAKDEMVVHNEHMGEEVNVYTIVVKKPQGKRPDERGYDTESNLREAGCDNKDWNYVVQDNVQWRALVNTVMKHLVL
jgi:hypothetical protein